MQHCVYPLHSKGFFLFPPPFLDHFLFIWNVVHLVLFAFTTSFLYPILVDFSFCMHRTPASFRKSKLYKTIRDGSPVQICVFFFFKSKQIYNILFPLLSYAKVRTLFGRLHFAHLSNSTWEIILYKPVATASILVFNSKAPSSRMYHSLSNPSLMFGYLGNSQYS